MTRKRYVVCDGCRKNIREEQSPPKPHEVQLTVRNRDTTLEFHELSCVGLYVSEEVSHQAALADTPDGPPPVTKENLLEALAKLSGHWVTVANRLAEAGVKGVCGNAVLCPVAMYLTTYFNRAANVDEGAVRVAVDKLKVDAKGDVEYDRFGEKAYCEISEWHYEVGDVVTVSTPQVIRQFITKFDNGSEACADLRLDDDDEELPERWRELVAVAA